MLNFIMLDFEKFKNSDFYKKTSIGIKFLQDDGNVSIKKSEIVLIDCTSIYEDNLFHILNTEDITTYKNMYLTLYNILISTNLDSVFRDLIINQWIEVRQNLSKFKYTPFVSHLLIMPEKILFPEHKHVTWSKQTISFMYYYNYNENNNSYIDVEDIKYIIPNKEKTLINLTNNPTHSAYIDSGWAFIWINDYKDNFEIPEEIFKEFSPIIV